MITDTTRSIYHPVRRDRVTFLKLASETNGECTLVEIEAAPGCRTALHSHHAYTERFTPITGDLRLQVGRDQCTLHPGESALVGRNILHRFHNVTQQPIRFYVEIVPASPGFEQALQIGYGLARDGLVDAAGLPKNLFVRGLLLELSSSRRAGLVSWLSPAFRLLAHIARRRGLYAALLERYTPHVARI